jgi:hypothetical protein
LTASRGAGEPIVSDSVALSALPTGDDDATGVEKRLLHKRQFTGIECKRNPYMALNQRACRTRIS